MHAAEAKARPSLRPKRPSIFRAREVGTLPLASVCAVAISRSMCVQLRTAGLVLPGSGRLLLSVSAACLDRPWLTMAERRLPAPVFVYDIKDPRSSSLALSLSCVTFHPFGLPLPFDLSRNNREFRRALNLQNAGVNVHLGISYLT